MVRKPLGLTYPCPYLTLASEVTASTRTQECFLFPSERRMENCLLRSRDEDNTLSAVFSWSSKVSEARSSTFARLQTLPSPADQVSTKDNAPNQFRRLVPSTPTHGSPSSLHRAIGKTLAQPCDWSDKTVRRKLAVERAADLPFFFPQTASVICEPCPPLHERYVSL